MIGHSIGEYVAACLAGVFSLEDALALVCARGRLMQSVSPGAMLAVSLPAAELHRIPLNGGLSLAASNSPTQSVVSGNAEEIDRLEQWLDQAGIKHRRLNTSHAFHSPMMDEILGAFGKEVAGVKLKSPQLPYISNLTGSWITGADATDPAYWVSHLRLPVLFFEGASLLFKEKRPVFVELGHGDALAALVRGTLKDHLSSEVVAAMGRSRNDDEASAHFLNALGFLWLHGAQVLWRNLHPGDHRRRLPLPAYPFERKRYWIQSAPIETEEGNRMSVQRGYQSRGLVYTPCWKRSSPIDPAQHDHKVCHWIIFTDSCGVGARMAQLLEARRQKVVKVFPGSSFTKVDSNSYQIDPLAPSDYDLLFQDLSPGGPLKIVHLWGLAPRSDGEEDLSGRLEDYRPIGLSSLLHLVVAYPSCQVTVPSVLTVVTNGAKDVSGEECLEVEQTAIPGFCQAVREAYANIDCRSIDVVLADHLSLEKDQIIERIIDETNSLRAESDTAYRGRGRWVSGFDKVTSDEGEPVFKSGGAYLIANGLSATGLQLVRELVETKDAKVVLTHPGPIACLEGLSGLPAEEDDSASRDETGRIFQQIKDIRDSVLILEADATNSSQMSNAALRAHEQFGSLHGIFYLADPPEDRAQSADPNRFQDVLSTAVRGALVLDALAETHGLDFLVFSSRYHSASRGIDKAIAGAVSSLFGALAARSDARKKTRKIAICWRGWEEEYRAPSSQGESQEVAESCLRARLPERPAHLLERLIAGAFCQVIISNSEIQPDAQSRRDMLIASPLSSTQDSSALLETGYSIPQPVPSHEIARGGLEGEIVEIWRTLLGVEHIGAHDNFFDLGGNSLIGIQVVSLVRQRFQIDMSLENLFDSPSPSEFAAIISQRLAEYEEPEKVGAPLLGLDGLTQ
jgi:hypothetical protein